jgi:hypothetical protein
MELDPKDARLLFIKYDCFWKQSLPVRESIPVRKCIHGMQHGWSGNEFFDFIPEDNLIIDLAIMEARQSLLPDSETVWSSVLSNFIEKCGRKGYEIPNANTDQEDDSSKDITTLPDQHLWQLLSSFGATRWPIQTVISLFSIPPQIFAVATDPTLSNLAAISELSGTERWAQLDLIQQQADQTLSSRPRSPGRGRKVTMGDWMDPSQSPLMAAMQAAEAAYDSDEDPIENQAAGTIEQQESIPAKSRVILPHRPRRGSANADPE